MAYAIEQRLLEDIGWREDELAALRTTYILESPDTAKGKGLRRSYLAMLYAHYEGFCKNAWEECQIEISRCGRPLSRIKNSIAAQFLAPEIAKLRNAPSLEFLDEVHAFRVRLLDVVGSDYAPIETSNLWPSVLIDALNLFDLDSSVVSNNSVALKSLVARRNDIAHGENVGISDRDLKTLQDAVWDVVLGLIIEIVSYFEDRRYIA